jgi:putative acetyltransferase
MSKAPTIREATDDDLDVVRRIVSAAYGGERNATLLDALQDSVAWLDLVFVAEEKDHLVAAGCYTRGWLDAPTKLVEVLVLSHVAVRPDRQRVGVGSQLVKESLRAVQDRDEPLVFLEGDPGFFSRLGFIAGSELGFTPPSRRIPVGAFQIATLPGYEQDVMTGAVVYPDVWWRHDAVGLRPEA